LDSPYFAHTGFHTKFSFVLKNLKQSFCSCTIFGFYPRSFKVTADNTTADNTTADITEKTCGTITVLQ